MSLKNVFDKDRNIRCLRIKVVAKQGEHYIVGDGSCLAICYSNNKLYETMKEGQSYLIQKPLMKDEHGIIPNEKLGPVKIEPFNIPERKQELKKLKSILSSIPVTPAKNQENLDSIKTFENIISSNAELLTVTAKIVNISKDIKGKYGSYNILKLKDIASCPIDLNLYKTNLRKNMNVGDVFELRNLKLIRYMKDQEEVTRLATTSRTVGIKLEGIQLFEKVPLGDIMTNGKVIAIDDIFSYSSCPQCWKKVDPDQAQCQCGNADTPLKDFHCNFFIETAENSDVEVVHTFRRQAKIIPSSLETDVIQKELQDNFMMKSFLFEWNICQDKDILRMVDIRHIKNEFV